MIYRYFSTIWQIFSQATVSFLGSFQILFYRKLKLIIQKALVCKQNKKHFINRDWYLLAVKDSLSFALLNKMLEKSWGNSWISSLLYWKKKWWAMKKICLPIDNNRGFDPDIFSTFCFPYGILSGISPPIFTYTIFNYNKSIKFI